MKKLLIVVPALMLMFALVSCGKESSPKNVATDRVFLTLDSNPTTGCTWMIKMDDSGVAEYVGSTYVQNKVDGPGDVALSGVGGKETFEFKCLKEGTANVNLKYGHAWAENEIYEVKNARIVVSGNLTGTIELY